MTIALVTPDGTNQIKSVKAPRVMGSLSISTPGLQIMQEIKPLQPSNPHNPTSSVESDTVTSPHASSAPSSSNDLQSLSPNKSSSSSIGVAAHRNIPGGAITSSSSSPTKKKKGEYHDCLIGTLLSPCELLVDQNKEKAAFFVFWDVAIRLEGQYRFKFTLKRMTFQQ